ncbi:MAG: helix-turn-helix transcriptional regulator [Planctomycetes bacterium]|nr:helix-turn-helix transcriptional regulator [Planctomycetota bacterium]
MYSPLDLPREFPLDVVLGGRRDDEPIRFLHVHNALEIGYCRDGSGTLFVGSKVLPFRGGDMTVITDLEMHRCQSARGTSSSWTWFFFQPALLLEPQFAGQYVYEAARYSGADFSNVLSGRDFSAIIAIIKEMTGEARSRNAHYRASLRALILVLLNRLHAAFGKRRFRVRDVPARRDIERICPALDLVSRQHHEPLALPLLASACHMSLRNFQIVFMRAMGCSPGQYLIRTRVRSAQGMLAGTDAAITQIALSCGFGSLSSFNRNFRKVAGRAPRAERGR